MLRTIRAFDIATLITIFAAALYGAFAVEAAVSGEWHDVMMWGALLMWVGMYIAEKRMHLRAFIGWMAALEIIEQIARGEE